MKNTEHEKQDAVEFLCENIPDIDELSLEVYSVIEEKTPEVLWYDSFDISNEKLEYFASKHFEIYSKQAQEILNDLHPSLILSSGMFGGKTTLSFIILERLLEEKKKALLLIADVMGEDYITARSYRGVQKRPATKFGALSNYEKTIDSIAQSDIDTVFLDEFSFLDVCLVEELQDMCLEKNKNLVLTGLNASYLGQPLSAFHENSNILSKSKVENCYSFVPGFCEKNPLGTNTIRYVNIGGKWLIDVGLLPLVVSKEKSHIVHYCPAMQEHTPVNLLREHQSLLNEILYPSTGKTNSQKKLLEYFSNNEVTL